jgi:hypothetical protein
MPENGAAGWRSVNFAFPAQGTEEIHEYRENLA